MNLMYLTTALVGPVRIPAPPEREDSDAVRRLAQAVFEPWQLIMSIAYTVTMITGGSNLQNHAVLHTRFLG